MKKLEAFAANAAFTQESIGVGVIGRRAASPVAPPAPNGRERARNVWAIGLDLIIPDPSQPRKDFDQDALARLAESLRTRGQLQPIQVRRTEGERYVILMGERRWRAAQMAGMESIVCVVRDGDIDDRERMAIQLIENCLREDLSAIDQARAFRQLLDANGWTYDQLAKELSIGKGTVTRAMSLLTLPDAVQDRVNQGDVAPTVAYEIAKLRDPKEQVRLAQTVAEQGLSHGDVAKEVRGASQRRKKAPGLQTVRVWRTGGFKIEISRPKGIEPGAARAAMQEAMDKMFPLESSASDAA